MLRLSVYRLPSYAAESLTPNTHWVPLEFNQLHPVLVRNLEGANVLPDDGTRRPEHVREIDG
jgi:hypothetical protein